MSPVEVLPAAAASSAVAVDMLLAPAPALALTLWEAVDAEALLCVADDALAGLAGLAAAGGGGATSIFGTAAAELDRATAAGGVASAGVTAPGAGVDEEKALFSSAAEAGSVGSVELAVAALGSASKLKRPEPSDSADLPGSSSAEGEGV